MKTYTIRHGFSFVIDANTVKVGGDKIDLPDDVANDHAHKLELVAVKKNPGKKPASAPASGSSSDSGDAGNDDANVDGGDQDQDQDQDQDPANTGNDQG